VKEKQRETLYFKGGRQKIYPDLKVSRLCLVVLTEVSLREGKALGVEEDIRKWTLL
jgi:hypothetical protein